PSTHTRSSRDAAHPGVHPPSLHDALPISAHWACVTRHGCGSPWGSKLISNKQLAMANDASVAAAGSCGVKMQAAASPHTLNFTLDRKSTRLNSSHVKISYAVFCLNNKTKG